jgi:hypothetical protein
MNLRRGSVAAWLPLAIAQLAAVQPARAQAEQGSVTFEVIDTFGRPVKQCELQISKDGAPDEQPLTVKAGSAIRLPYGQYTAIAHASFYETALRRFLLWEPNLLVVVALPPHLDSHSSMPGHPVDGVLTGILPRSGLQVRIISLYGDSSKEATVREGGEFTLENVPNGIYLLAVMRNYKLIGAKLIAPSFDGPSRELTVDAKDLRKF